MTLIQKPTGKGSKRARRERAKVQILNLTVSKLIFSGFFIKYKSTNRKSQYIKILKS
jgi:hypothetical protein